MVSSGPAPRCSWPCPRSRLQRLRRRSPMAVTEPAAAGVERTAGAGGAPSPISSAPGRHLPQPTYVTAPPGDAAGCSSSSRRDDPRRPRRAQARQPFLDIRSRPGRRRARPAVDGVRPGLRARTGSSTSTTRATTATSTSGVPRAPQPGAKAQRAESSRTTAPTRTTTAASSSSAPTAASTSARATAAAAATRSATRQNPARLLGKILRIDPRRGSAVRDPAPQPVRARRGPSPRCSRTACATRGASRSTARPATCRSPTSARTSTRRSTS